MKTLVAFLSCAAIAAAFPSTEEEQKLEWSAWKTYHGKSYSSETEEALRMGVWLNNMRIIEEHNSDKNNTYWLGMNKFGDLTLYEYKQLFLKARGRHSNSTVRTGSTYLKPSNVELPRSVDWRSVGCVTRVKNQGNCGSSWAFSATGSLEGQHYRKTGRLVSLSEQNLVDCSYDYGNNGCRDGLPDNAFHYIYDNNGIDTEWSYPYEAREGRCRFDRRNVGATLTGSSFIRSGDEQLLQYAVANEGPISVGIDASHSSFQFYRGGVYRESRCSRTNLDLGLLIVGYGNYLFQDYWLVKNAFGVGWGNAGYAMIARNSNQCGIATSASFPLV